MILTRALSIALLSAFAAAGPALAQGPSGDLRNDLLAHFERSSRKMELLSQAVPQELYTWSPGEGVMSIARVYMHIARYNYMYLEENLDIAAPSGVDWQNFESISDKQVVVESLLKSIEHVKQAVGSMNEEQLERETTLYGSQVAGWAVLVQLVAHMNEHVGQSIAYARMNGIIPPWSR